MRRVARTRAVAKASPFSADGAGRVLSFTVEDLNREADGKGSLGVFTRL